MGEVAIDNWLFKQGIPHGYERKLPIPEEAYCDFYIPLQNSRGYLYLEYWGLENDEYNKRKEEKINLYEKYGFQRVDLFPDDLDHLDDVLPKKLRDHLPDSKFF